MSFITVAVVTALCFLFASTRKFGILGTGLALYFQPYPTIGVMLVAGIAYYFYRRTIT